jgi:hypothetical protein
MEAPVTKTFKIPETLYQWLKTGERGISSETMVEHLTGFPCLSPHFGPSHPLDPSDFGRCMKLLNAVPELRLRLDEMRTLSPVWNALVDNWDRFEILYIQALASLSGMASELYDEMKKIGC